MLASQQSMASKKHLCLADISSMICPNFCNCVIFVGVVSYSFPFSHELSKAVRHSTRSALFFSCGSTTSMLVSYLRNSSLRSSYDCLIFFASDTMAL